MNTLEIIISNEEYGDDPYISSYHNDENIGYGTYKEGFRPIECNCPNCGQRFNKVIIINKNEDKRYMKNFKDNFDKEEIPVEIIDKPEKSCSIFG